jgi:hypothetical protein
MKQKTFLWMMLLSGICTTVVLALSAMKGYAVEVDKTLVMYLPFDEGQGQVAQDKSNTGLQARLDGPKWVAGKFGKALEFDGINDIVTVDDAAPLRLLNGGTLMAWIFIKGETGHASWPRIVIKSETNGGTGTGYDFLLDRAQGYSLRFCTGGACNTLVNPLSLLTWHYIAVTFDGKNIRAYVDGKEIGAVNQPGPTTDSAGQKAGIGNSPVESRPYQGILDEIRLWSRALTGDEIRGQMNKGAQDILAASPLGKLATTWGTVKGD